MFKRLLQIGKQQELNLSVEGSPSSKLVNQTRYLATFKDPFSQDDVRSDAPPASLLKIQDLKEGFNFLHEFGQFVDITITFVPHSENDASLLKNPDLGYEDTVRQSQIALFEGFGHTKEHERYLNALSGASTEPVDQNIHARLSESKYTASKLDSIRGTGVHAGYFDIPNKPEGSVESQFIALLNDNTSSIDELNRKQGLATAVDSELIDKDVDLTVDQFALENFREWYFVLQAGSKIGEIIGGSQDLQSGFGGDKKIKASMLVGEAHRDMVRKFHALGVLVKQQGIRYADDQGLELKSFMGESFSSGSVDKIKLRKIVEKDLIVKVSKRRGI